MKKFLLWFGLMLSVCVMAACSGGSSSPEGVAKHFVEAAYAGDAEEVISMVELPEDAKKPGVEDIINGKLKAAVANYAEKAEKNGGIKEIVVDDPQYSEDKKQATVQVTVHFKDNNVTKTERVKLVATDNGWKLKI